MRTWKVQWINRHAQFPVWHDFKTFLEEWDREERAEMRVKGYWEKLGLPLEFRVVEVVPVESLKEANE